MSGERCAVLKFVGRKNKKKKSNCSGGPAAEGSLARRVVTKKKTLGLDLYLSVSCRLAIMNSPQEVTLLEKDDRPGVPFQVLLDD